MLDESPYIGSKYLIICVENDFSVAVNRQQRLRKTEHTIQDL